jgi:hypothetical protein
MTLGWQPADRNTLNRCLQRQDFNIIRHNQSPVFQTAVWADDSRRSLTCGYENHVPPGLPSGTVRYPVPIIFAGQRPNDIELMVNCHAAEQRPHCYLISITKQPQ